MDPVGIAVIVVGLGIAIAVIALVLRALNRSLASDAIWRSGRPERACIVSIRETGRSLGRAERPSPEVELESSADRRTVQFFARRDARERLQAGAMLDVRISPHDETRLAVDPALRVR